MKVKFQPILITNYSVESLKLSRKTAATEVCWYGECSSVKPGERAWEPRVLIDVSVLPVCCLENCGTSAHASYCLIIIGHTFRWLKLSWTAEMTK